MTSHKKLFALMLLISLALLSHGNIIYEDNLSHEEDEHEPDVADTAAGAVDGGSVPLRGIGRFLAENGYSRVPPVLATCDRYPKICRVKGSPGRDCCKKRCVDAKTDRLNCGACGSKCKYSEICCKGKCVNPMSDKKHCGGCNNECRQRKGKCVYGMCTYA